MGKVTLKSKVDEALSNEFSKKVTLMKRYAMITYFKSNAKEALNVGGENRSYAAPVKNLSDEALKRIKLIEN